MPPKVAADNLKKNTATTNTKTAARIREPVFKPFPEKDINQMQPNAIEQECKDLKHEIGKAQMECQILKKEIQEREARFLKREKEYREIIADLNRQVKSRNLLNEKEDDHHINGLKTTNTKINDNIDLIQSKTTKVLAEQEKDIIRFYNSKIKELQHQFEEENIKKGKKDLDFLKKENKLISELEWIKDISYKIDNENHNWMKKYMDQKVDYEAQENDRQMLLNEVVLKKKKNAMLFSQYKEYKKLFEIMTQDLENAQTDVVEEASNTKSKKQVLPSINKRDNYVDISKLDERSMNLKRLQAIYGNMESLYGRERDRYKRLRKLFDNELMKQTELESEVKSVMQQYLTNVYKKRMKDYDEAMVASNEYEPQHVRGITDVPANDAELYRTQLTKEERQELVRYLQSNNKISMILREKLALGDNNISVETENAN